LSKIKQQYLDSKFGIVVHNNLVYRIAEKYGLDPVRVNKTIRVLFTHRGILKHLRMGNTINITGFGFLRPTVTRKTIMKRQAQIKRGQRRIKRKIYVRKIAKSCNKFANFVLLITILFTT